MNDNIEKTSIVASDLDAILNEYLELQIICMLLHHEGCNKIRAGKPTETENGLIMLESVGKMRARLNEQKMEILALIGEEEFREARIRTQFNRKLFVALSDNVFADNRLYFYYPERPTETEYQCDEISCKAKIFMLTRDYFPSFFETAT